MSIFVTIQDTVIVLCLFFWRKRSVGESHKFRLEKLACTKLQVACTISAVPFMVTGRETVAGGRWNTGMTAPAHVDFLLTPSPPPPPGARHV